MVNFELLKSGLRYLSEIFTICSSHVCANLMKKFLPLLNRPAHNGPFLPKFWTALATVIVGIFFRKKFWWGLRPISVAYQKEFWISWKKRRFQIFQKPSSPGFQSFLASQSHNSTLNAWNFFPKIAGFVIIDLLGVFICTRQGVLLYFCYQMFS